MSLLRLLGFGTETDAAPDDRDAADTRTMRRIAAELETLPAARARYLAAFACILGRVAHADSSVSAAETAKMQEIVRVLGHLPAAQAVLVVEIAKNQVRLFGGTENFLVSRRFKELSTAGQRVELLDCVFAVSAADESITVAEESQATADLTGARSHPRGVRRRAGRLRRARRGAQGVPPAAGVGGGSVRGFASSMTATQRKSLVFSSAILTTIVRGTENSMPIGPHTQPQKTSETNTTSADSPSRRPISVGSTRLPKMTLMAR